MVRTSILAVLLAVAVMACGSTATPSPSTAAVADAGSPSAASSPSPSPSPSPSASPSPTPSPTATPVPTPAPTPVPWKTYTSKRYHYLMKYPPEWVVTPGTTKLADQYDDYGFPFVYVSRDTTSGSFSLNLTVSHDIAGIKSHYAAKVVSNKSIKLAGGYAGRIITFTGKDSGLKITIQSIVLVKGGVAYFIELYGDYATTAADEATFKKMYTSWRPR